MNEINRDSLYHLLPFLPFRERYYLYRTCKHTYYLMSADKRFMEELLHRSFLYESLYLDDSYDNSKLSKGLLDRADEYGRTHVDPNPSLPYSRLLVERLTQKEVLFLYYFQRNRFAVIVDDILEDPHWFELIRTDCLARKNSCLSLFRCISGRSTVDTMESLLPNETLDNLTYSLALLETIQSGAREGNNLPLQLWAYEEYKRRSELMLL